MKRMICAGAWMLAVLTTDGQWKWDGGAGDSSWTSAANWHPDGMPAIGNAVLLDNSILNQDYEIRLPTGTGSVSLDSLILRPGPGKCIRLVIPSGSRAAPALTITGPGESLRIDSGAVLLNASGATAGDPLQVAGWLRISDGGRYIHATPRGNAKLIDRLSTSVGTATGVFEFDVPGTSGYTVSLTGNTFGSLVFSANAAGGLKSYSGSGSSDLHIRGDLVVDPGAGLTSTLTANIRLDRHLRIRGLLSLQPATAGSSGRSLMLLSPQNGIIDGVNVQLHQHFREVVIGAGHQTQLQSNWTIPLTGQRMRVMETGTLSMGMFAISGSGTLEINAGGWLRMAHPAGIRMDGTDGNIRTASRQLHAGAIYVYEGTGDQHTGDGIPDTISTLCTDKSTGVLRLSKTLQVTAKLSLIRGRIISSDSCLLVFSGDTISDQPNEFGMDSCGSNNAFIDGPFRRIINRSGKFSMPIGKDGVFRPLILSRSSGRLLVCRATYSNGSTPSASVMADPNIYRIHGFGYWTILIEQATDDSLLIPEIGWTYNGDSLNRMRWMDSLSIVTNALTGANGWKIIDPRPLMIDHGKAGIIRSNQPMNTSSLIALGMTGVPVGLPITGISLSARKMGTTTKLDWVIHGNTDAVRFVIKRNTHRYQADTIGILTVTHIQNKSLFSHTDPRPYIGWNTYLVCAEESGQETKRCSGIAAVYHPPQQALELFPVPAIDQLHWRLSHKTDAGWIRILNKNGREMWKSRTAGSDTGYIDLRQWPPGVYHIQIPMEGTVFSRSFLKAD
jgi:hypothetical protein